VGQLLLSPPVDRPDTEMEKQASADTNIDTSLRFALFGLECAMGLEFSAKEVERVFRDAREDKVSAKEYVFLAKDKLVVYGNVCEYEPDTIHLHVDNGNVDQELLNNIMERAKYQELRRKSDNLVSGISSPRLANPQQASELMMEVFDLKDYPPNEDLKPKT
jgi:hypothetical protein